MHQYSESYKQASAIADKAGPGRREDAAYIAGLSAYQLGRTVDAERYLVMASTSSNTSTALKAKAMLGQVRLDQNRPGEAAGFLAEAAQGLPGEDGTMAASNAAIAYHQAGDDASSRNWSNIASGQSNAPTTMKSKARKKGGTQTTSSSGFTLQVGVFSEKNRAERAAEDAQQLAQRDGLGQVLVVPRRDDRGKIVFVVQFGSFPTRNAAAAARSKLGRLDYIVALARG